MTQTPTFGVCEVNHFLVLEDVDLLNSWDGVHPEPFQGVLQPLVICRGGLVDSFLLSKKQKNKLSKT